MDRICIDRDEGKDIPGREVGRSKNRDEDENVRCTRGATDGEAGGRERVSTR